MEEYEVRITPQAREQIAEYALYIRDELLSPMAANKYVQDMYKAIRSLSAMPKRLNLIAEEPWRTEGVRKLITRGYYIYFWIDESQNTVTVFGVVYGKMEQVNQLLNLELK